MWDNGAGCLVEGSSAVLCPACDLRQRPGETPKLGSNVYSVRGGQSRMFAISNDALASLCNALFSLQGWFGVLEHFGLASEEEYQEMKYFGEQYPAGEEGFFSWNNLHCHLDLQDSAIAPRVQALCTDLLRRRDKYAEMATDEDRFRNALAEFEVRLEHSGFKFDGIEIREAVRAMLPSEQVFPKGAQYNAFKVITGIMQSATKEILVVDNFLGSSLLGTIDAIPSKPVIRLLTFKPSADFKNAVTAFQKQYGQSIEVKVHQKDVHDRAIIIDDTSFFVLGASIKDLGDKLSLLNKLEDPSKIQLLRSELETIWASAQPL
jgi:hypothetical protein